MKSLVNANNPQTIQDMNEEIIRVLNGIQKEMCEEDKANFVKSQGLSVKTGGPLMDNILSHY